MQKRKDHIKKKTPFYKERDKKKRIEFANKLKTIREENKVYSV